MHTSDDARPTIPTEVEITPLMIEAGADAVYSLLGSGDLGHLCSARALHKSKKPGTISLSSVNGKPWTSLRCGPG